MSHITEPGLKIVNLFCRTGSTHRSLTDGLTRRDGAERTINAFVTDEGVKNASLV